MGVKNGTTFKFLHVWNIMKMSEKWQDIESLERFTGDSSKRTKTSKTTHNQSSDSMSGLTSMKGNLLRFQEPFVQREETKQSDGKWFG